MSLRGLIVLLLFSFLFLKGFSQTVSGTITDAQTNEPLPFVNVYISNTTKGTQTDIKGGFTLKLQRAGFVKVVCSMVGYKTFEQAADELADYMMYFASLNRRQRIELRNKTEAFSDQFDWETLAKHYHHAHDLAMLRTSGTHQQGKVDVRMV